MDDNERIKLQHTFIKMLCELLEITINENILLKKRLDNYISKKEEENEEKNI